MFVLATDLSYEQQRCTRDSVLVAEILASTPKARKSVLTYYSKEFITACQALVQDLERRELHILRELVAANEPSNLETPGVDGTLEKMERVARDSGVHRQQEKACGSSWRRFVTKLEPETEERWCHAVHHELEHCWRE